MVSGLIANQIFHTLTPHPLSVLPLLATWDVVMLCILWLGMYTNRDEATIPTLGWRTVSWKTYTMIIAASLAPLLAGLATFRVNNGGGAGFSQVVLLLLAGILVFGVIARKHLRDGTLMWAVFCIGLAVLLMTSLRGWDIIGHDIEREFRVFSLTHDRQHWDIAADRGPYNACLSITILPEVISRLINVSGLVVFKGILQVIFAVCGCVVFTIVRRYASRLGAFVGAALFICYPTFINDSAMLTRQGVAYVFFALALLVLVRRQKSEQWKLIFLLCSMGSVLSHYSTAYMYVGLFAAATVIKFLVTRWREWRENTSLKHTYQSVLSPRFAVIVFLMTFAWYTQITVTSGGLTDTLKSSIANIPKVFSGDNKSSDTSTALLFASPRTSADLYSSYLTTSVKGGKLPDAKTFAEYIPVLTNDTLPLTPIGKKAKSVGISPSLVTSLRQNYAKVLQLLAVLGVLYTTIRWLRKSTRSLDTDLICLNFAGVVLLALMVILPVLSVNYGILRAFQQALIFLLLPIVLLLARFVRNKKAIVRTRLVIVSAPLLFLLFTGFFAQVLGGSSPTFNLNNQGLYYGLYYTDATDQQSFTWMKQNLRKGEDVHAANFNRAAMYDPEYPFNQPGILPTQVGPDSYVYLDHAQLVSHKLYIYYQSSPLIMTFPMEYYEQTKDRIYSTPSTGVYH